MLREGLQKGQQEQQVWKSPWKSGDDAPAAGLVLGQSQEPLVPPQISPFSLQRRGTGTRRRQEPASVPRAGCREEHATIRAPLVMGGCPGPCKQPRACSYSRALRLTFNRAPGHFTLTVKPSTGCVLQLPARELYQVGSTPKKGGDAGRYRASPAFLRCNGSRAALEKFGVGAGTDSKLRSWSPSPGTA